MSASKYATSILPYPIGDWYKACPQSPFVSQSQENLTLPYWGLILIPSLLEIASNVNPYLTLLGIDTGCDGVKSCCAVPYLTLLGIDTFGITDIVEVFHKNLPYPIGDWYLVLDVDSVGDLFILTLPYWGLIQIHAVFFCYVSNYLTLPYWGLIQWW